MTNHRVNFNSVFTSSLLVMFELYCIAVCTLNRNIDFHLSDTLIEKHLLIQLPSGRREVGEHAQVMLTGVGKLRLCRKYSHE